MLSIACPPAFAHLDQAYLERLAATVLTGEGISPAVEISLVITDNEGIRALNRQYRGLDAPTDVLAFPMLPADGEAFVIPPDHTVQLGDIVISYEKVREQAVQLRHSERQELAELFVHGLLHLLGYDHERDEDAAVMAEKAETYIRSRSHFHASKEV